MVGTLRSTGCETCRKRKKKCDKELPSCSACIKAGWKCPGYSRRWKFVDENGPLALHYRHKKYIFKDVDPSELAGDEGTAFQGVLINGKSIALKAISQTTIEWSLASPHDQLRSTLCYILDEPQNRHAFPIKSHGRFYAMIPARLGRNTALDDAASCLCGIYVDSLRSTQPPSEECLRLYARSLRSLRKSLDIQHTRAQAETICASIIMQGCELVLDDDGGRWRQLCMGTKLLMQEYGPERFTEPFERAMLEAQRAWFILQDASIGQECFLSRQEWRQLLKSSTAPIATVEHAGISLRSELNEFLVDVPGLAREASSIADELLNGKPDSAGLLERRQKAIIQISSLKRAFELWYCTKVAPQRPIPGVPLPNKVEIPRNSSPQDELLFAIVDCVSNCVMIKLDSLWASIDSNRHVLKVDILDFQKAQSKRKLIMHQSFQFVRASSHIAAKPLEFGLQQLLLDAGFEQRKKAHGDGAKEDF
ncbi:uncharacterized protein Z520_00963 [Fonsecaea multimorphosa CBS 102226]|uniref:Zn(2)-C6 fungal-type domain-containing protein n=1 Tax=Fonsecaea multimorphosa CBS 102226 TaxID=1442371 RepID=A0A0D2K8V6_9EURO|nr:uncharacterized protein Z520_00963 [Fonsecaea multimorphosa CBS 102226]KIY02498.1 hypothetical protein Z520_00963 [Fonsecaea multimorphosa CBS 102226]OAL31366.1 hypothetical protein AYO22_00958 [Fonsecaea multimorphosa]